MKINSKRILKFILNVIIGYSPIFYLLIYAIIGALKLRLALTKETLLALVYCHL